MDTNGHEGAKLLHGDLVYAIIGGALEVLKNLRVGLIINFKKPKLEWERIVL